MPERILLAGSQVVFGQGVDRKGNKVKGELAGRNASLIKAELRKQGIYRGLGFASSRRFDQSVERRLH